MPELAEVEFYRKRWNPGIGNKVQSVETHPSARIFRGCDVAGLVQGLTGAVLESSQAAAKQMLFKFSASRKEPRWLGIHLGMTGELSVKPADFTARKSDHLIFRQAGRSLVFSDARMFGKVQFSTGQTAPDWWTSLPPPLLSDDFTVDYMATFCRRRARSPIKAVLLMQERFPGIGNWMADEILWRSSIHPKQAAGSLTKTEQQTLHREIRYVADFALRTIGETYEDPPATWLFPHRWEDGGVCPQTGARLIRETVGGRTTCWSPAKQILR